MSSEAKKRADLVKLMRPWHAIPVENPAKPGTPDLNFTFGWIELKYLRNWPRLAETVVRIETYTPQQRNFARARAEAGGKVWFMLVVGNEWLLFRGEDAAEHIGSLTAEGLYDLAVGAWTRMPKREELDRCLTCES